jgi:uncharacterized protein (DUF1697 family)
MADLKEMCCDAGFQRVQTYIASGNVVFHSKATAAKVKAELETRLRAHAGKPVGVVVRSASEMQAVLHANPFPKAEPKYTCAIFLNEAPPRDALAHVSGQRDEQVTLGDKEIFVYYPDGMGRSKLKIPAARMGTARNMNTVAKLVEIASRL